MNEKTRYCVVRRKNMPYVITRSHLCGKELHKRCVHKKCVRIKTEWKLRRAPRCTNMTKFANMGAFLCPAMKSPIKFKSVLGSRKTHSLNVGAINFNFHPITTLLLWGSKCRNAEPTHQITILSAERLKCRTNTTQIQAQQRQH